jgi:hypothetical protein
VAFIIAEYGGKTFWDLNSRKHRKELHQITSGSDGNCGDYICEAGLFEERWRLQGV